MCWSRGQACTHQEDQDPTETQSCVPKRAEAVPSASPESAGNVTECSYGAWSISQPCPVARRSGRARTQSEKEEEAHDGHIGYDAEHDGCGADEEQDDAICHQPRPATHSSSRIDGTYAMEKYKKQRMAAASTALPWLKPEPAMYPPTVSGQK
jgi:hypothetical protein